MSATCPHGLTPSQCLICKTLQMQPQPESRSSTRLGIRKPSNGGASSPTAGYAVQPDVIYPGGQPVRRSRLLGAHFVLLLAAIAVIGLVTWIVAGAVFALASLDRDCSRWPEWPVGRATGWATTGVARGEPEDRPSPIRAAGYSARVYTVPADRFDELVQDALEELPPELAKAIENVAIIIEDHADGRPLFGLYEGVPLTKRGPLSYSGAFPDRITIYQGTISAVCQNEADLVEQIRKTVLHEVAHHFGISDPRLEELGWS